MTSTKKVKANRRNAKKSTGPKSARGKSLSSLNALKLGVFARERLIPGESERDHDELYDRLLAELKPSGVIEALLVDQIVGDIWRLRRVENAEIENCSEHELSFHEKVIKTLSLEELTIMRRYAYGLYLSEAGEESQSPQSANLGNEATRAARQLSQYADKDKVEAVLRKFEQPGEAEKSVLNGIANSGNASALNNIDRMRRALVRDIIQKYETLLEMQERRRTIEPPQNDRAQ